MEARAQAHSTRPKARTHKFLQSFSQFKGIIRLSGFKVRDGRDGDQFPYPSLMDTTRSSTTTKPYMSQPTLELEGGGKNNDGELSKLSGLSERFPSRDGNTQEERSFDPDFPLRSHPRSCRSSKKSDSPLPGPLQLPSHFNRPVQSPNRVDNTAITPNELPPLTEPTMTSQFITDINPSSKAQPGRRRPSSASSVLTSSTTVRAKASGPLVKLKQSFSQLQSTSSFKSDVTGQLLSPESTITHALPSSSTISSPPPSSPSQVPVSKSPTPTIVSSICDPPVRAAATSTPTINATMVVGSHPRPHYPNITASGALAPMSFPKHLPPHPGNIQQRSSPQPPKLNLLPVNPRISLTISPTLMTDTGPARFSPTVISRPMPLPLSNLPTLTPRPDSSKAASSLRGTLGSSDLGSGVGGALVSKDTGKRQSSKTHSKMGVERRVGKQQLKSMPALPIQGSGRGVNGHEESDGTEEEDSADDEDELEDEEELPERPECSKPTFFASDMSTDSFRSSFDNSMSTAGLDCALSSSISNTFQRMRKKERDGASPLGSSCYSVLNGDQLPPATTGSSIGLVPLLKEPTPPHAHLVHVQHTTTSPSLELQSTDSLSTPYHTARLPEVDASSLDISFLSAPSLRSSAAAATSVDVKGKGRARDLDLPVTSGLFTPSAASATVTESATRADYNYDPSQIPSTVTSTISPTTKNPSGNEYSGAGTGSAFRILNDHIHGQGSSMTSAAQSPTETIRQLRLERGVGKNRGGVDYFTAKRLSLGPDVDDMAGLATSLPPASARDHSSMTTSTSSYPHFRDPVVFAPSPTSHSSQTSRFRAEGFLGDMSKPRSPALTMMGLDSVGRVGRGYAHDARNLGGGNVGGQVFTMPKMYKRMSQSQVDLHTIEMREKKRLMEAEVRVKEELELAKFRERERKRQVSLKDREAIEIIAAEERISYDKINGADDKDDEEVPPAVPPKVTMPRSPVIAATTTTITINVHDDVPSAFSSTSKSTTTSAATQRQNRDRLSTVSHYLRRRRSMPMYDGSSEPPPYPSFARHPPTQYRIMPREDEGHECLPSYTNPIYLKAIMPRKMEFSSFGVQARDRKWRRVMCVLDGTVLRVYKCPPGCTGVGALGEWWERQVGAGDVSLQPSHAGAVSNIQIETRESRRLAEERRDLERQIQRIMKAEDVSDGRETDDVFEPPPAMLAEGCSTRSRTGSSVSLQQTPVMSTSSSSKSRFAQFLKPGPWHHMRSKSEHVSLRNVPDQSPRPSLNIASGSGATTPGSVASARSASPFGSPRPQTAMSNSSLNISASNSGLTGRETPSPSIHGHQHRQGQQEHKLQRQFLYSNREISFIPDPDPEDLIKEYTLQNAESGIGNDYFKRKNVIRLRLGGEQFLLQARDVTGVVEWIEALQAATNIALDLDDRPMPRGPLFPRRRRRRRPLVGMNINPSAEANVQAETTTMITPPFTTAVV